MLIKGSEQRCTEERILTRTALEMRREERNRRIRKTEAQQRQNEVLKNVFLETVDQIPLLK